MPNRQTTSEQLQARIQFHTEEANRLLQLDALVREFQRHLEQIAGYQQQIAKEGSPDPLSRHNASRRLTH